MSHCTKMWCVFSFYLSLGWVLSIFCLCLQGSVLGSSGFPSVNWCNMSVSQQYHMGVPWRLPAGNCCPPRGSLQVTADPAEGPFTSDLPYQASISTHSACLYINIDNRPDRIIYPDTHYIISISQSD